MLLTRDVGGVALDFAPASSCWRIRNESTASHRTQRTHLLHLHREAANTRQLLASVISDWYCDATMSNITNVGLRDRRKYSKVKTWRGNIPILEDARVLGDVNLHTLRAE
jgi:hypothetical protein